MQSRQALKEHLKKTIAEGEEIEYLRDAEEELSRLQTNLQQLQERRANLRRQITIRERKLLDWKSKIPRADGALPSADEVAKTMSTLPSAACHEVARISNVNSENGKISASLSVKSHFRTGLKGLAGFDKAWLVLVNKNMVGELQGDDACGDGIQLPSTQCIPTVSGIDLVLVDIVNCDERFGMLEIVPVQQLSTSSNISPTLAESSVIDIKPYLSYCDSK